MADGPESVHRGPVDVHVLRLRLRPGAADAYDAAHRDVPDEVLASLRRSGLDDLQIYRDGDDLFAVVLAPAGVDPATLVDPDPTPAVADWEARMAELQAPVTAGGPPEWVPVRRVFGLRDQIAGGRDGPEPPGGSHRRDAP